MSQRAYDLAEQMDWTNPLESYERVIKARMQNLKRLADQPGALPALLEYYMDDRWAEFISDFGWTFDPRETDDRLKLRPFVLTPRQVDYTVWVQKLYKEQRTGVCRKHRDAGMSWLNAAIGCLFWLAKPNVVIPYGSQNETKVDAGPGNPDSLFWKIRAFISKLPTPMQPQGWQRASKTFQVVNPTNSSVLLGEIGDAIGRGGRSTMAFPDEFGELMHPVLVESSLAANTNCIVYGGTIPTSGWKGSHFWQLEQRHPDDGTFVFEWWADPRKRQHPDLPAEQEPWYKETEAKHTPIVFKTQYLMQDDTSDAVQFIPSEPITAAFQHNPSTILLHPTLPWRISVDAAGMGNDKIKVRCRRGRFNRPVITLPNMDGVQLASAISTIATDCLKSAPVELISIERDGPGASAADQLKYGPWAPIVVAVHTGAKSGDGKHYNLRAWLHQQAKDYLEQEQPFIPYDAEFLKQATSIHYAYKGGLLLIESKEEYRKRFAADHSRAAKFAARSPDNWDSFMLSFVPPRGRPITSLVTQTPLRRNSGRKNAYAL
jgi:hypothetical protein